MKRTLSLLLVLVMVFAMVPNVFAAETDNSDVDFGGLLEIENYSPLTVNLNAGAEAPAVYVWTPAEDGTLSYDLNDAETTVSITLTQGEATVTSEAGVVSLAVVANEPVEIEVSDINGAAIENLVINGTFSTVCVHVAGEPVQENVVEATCTAEGSYDSVVYCTLCNEKLSSTAVVVDALGHTWGDPVRTEATTEANAFDTYTCTVCGETKVEEVPDSILPSFEITTQPTDQHVALGSTVTFTVEATGAATYLWQRQKPGSNNWTNCTFTGWDTASISFKASLANQMPYRCIITDASDNTLITNEVTYTTYVPDPMTNVTGQTGDQVVQFKKYVTFSVTVDDPSAIVSYRWQKRSINGTYWTYTSVDGYDTDTVTFTATYSKLKYYRCRMVDKNGVEFFSEPVTFTFAEPPVELKVLDYSDKVFAVNSTKVSISVVAQGSNVTYQWQRTPIDQENWQNTGMAGNTTDTLTFTVYSTTAGYLYRCQISDDYGNTVNSRSIKVTQIKQFKITSQPTDQVMEGGNPVQFQVVATGSNLSYRWQYVKTEGTDFVYTSMDGYNTDTLTVSAAKWAGHEFRCAITDASGTTYYSDPVTFTVAE